VQTFFSTNTSAFLSRTTTPAPEALAAATAVFSSGMTLCPVCEQLEVRQKIVTRKKQNVRIMAPLFGLAVIYEIVADRFAISLVDNASFHHEIYVLDHGDVQNRISSYSNEVGKQP
jgi:hypothetical protein